MTTSGSVLEFINAEDWEIVHDSTSASQPAAFKDPSDLTLSAGALRLLRSQPAGIYRHQHEAIRQFLEGINVAITTPTASGKTLAFNASAVHVLEETDGVIIAVYPLKALASEQEERWKSAIESAAINVQVGRIDGSVPMPERLQLIANCRVLIMTPDIIHAWLLRKLSENSIAAFISRIKLVIVDEAHSYTGVFGSNSAFVFRRLTHVAAVLGARFNYIAASATMDQPLTHLETLTGQEFSEVGESWASAPRSQVRTIFVRPKGESLSELGKLLSFAATKTEHKTIAFVDSRQTAEHAAVIAGRMEDADLGTSLDAQEEVLHKLKLPASVLPYRAGYAEEDRSAIQKALSKGSLRAVVSTSALELGVDIHGLSLCILFGVPPSGSSFRQRYGRVGRGREGLVIVLNDGSPRSNSVFKDPLSIWDLPLTRSSLYLHNKVCQYIHALCLAKSDGGGEDEVACQRAARDPGDFQLTGLFPADFVELCLLEKNGLAPEDLHHLKMQGNEPQLQFPLRDIGMQFSINHRLGPHEQELGRLSFSQLMREAYPGAVHYHQTRPYRVTKVSVSNRRVDVRTEKKYFTSAAKLPTSILPDIRAANTLNDFYRGSLRLVECTLQMRESIVGFKERRGGNAFDVKYPLDPKMGMYWDQPYFNRSWYTTGVLLCHPCLMNEDVDVSSLAALMVEAFFIEIPFDRQDVDVGHGRIKVSVNGFEANSRFICISDKQHSLRLSGEVLAPGQLQKVLDRALDMSEDDAITLGPATIEALRILSADARLTAIPAEEPDSSPSDVRFQLIIKPGSSGLNSHRDNEEFFVSRVFFSPALNQLAYAGLHGSERRRAQGHNGNGPAATIVPLTSIQPIHGESDLGWFDIDQGLLIDQLPGEF